MASRSAASELDLATMQKRRAQIVKQSTLGIAGLFKAAGVTGLQGHGKLLSGNRVEFTGKDGKKEELTAKHVVLAAGSAPIELEEPAVRWQADRRFVGRARIRRRAATPRRDRRRHHRSGTRQRVAAPRFRGGRAGSARYIPAGGGWRGVEGSAQALQEARARCPPGREGQRRGQGRGRRQAEVHRREAASRASRSTRSSWPSDAGRSPRICSATARAFRSTSAASSMSTTNARPPPPTSGRSETWCAGRCSRTRARKKA